MASELVELTQALIRLNTSHPNFEKKLECLNLIKEKIGERVHVQEFEFQKFPSLLFSTQNSNHFDLLLVGHIDVVPGPDQLFKPQVKTGKLFGRGAYDMKGSVAAMVIALRKYSQLKKQPKNIGLLLTSDEEIDGQNGVKAVLEKTNLTAKFALLPDNGQNWEIVLAERGLLHIRTSRQQKEELLKILSAHFPNRGNENREWVTTFSTEDIFADQFDIRVRVAKEADRQKIIDLLSGAPHEVIRQHNGFETPENNSHVQVLRELTEKFTGQNITFAREYRTNESDGIYFGEHNIPIALVRPTGGGMHRDSEWVDIPALKSLSKILNKLLRLP